MYRSVSSSLFVSSTPSSPVLIQRSLHRGAVRCGGLRGGWSRSRTAGFNVISVRRRRVRLQTYCAAFAEGGYSEYWKTLEQKTGTACFAVVRVRRRSVARDA